MTTTTNTTITRTELKGSILYTYGLVNGVEVIIKRERV